MGEVTQLSAFVRGHGYDFQVTENLVNGEFHTIHTEHFKIWLKAVRIDGRLVAWLGDWRNTAKKFHFVEEQETLDSKGLRALNKFNKQVEKDREQKQLQAKLQVEELLTRFTKVTDQGDYLKTKKLSPSADVFVRLSEEDSQKILCVPMYDETGEVWNLQQLYKSGKKTFHPKARIKGLFHKISGQNETVLIGEGYATCLAANQATNFETYCAFNVGNLEGVLRTLLKIYRPNQLILLGDWDAETFEREGINPGMQKCAELAHKYAIRVAVPTETLGLNYDFCDLWTNGQAEELKSRVLEPWGSERLDQWTFKVDKPKTATELVIEDEFHLSVPAVTKTKVTAEKMPQPMDTWLRAAAPTLSVTPAEDADFPTKPDGFFFLHHGGNNGGVKLTPDFEGFSSYLGRRLFCRTNDSFNYMYKDGYYAQITNLQLKQLAHGLLKPNIPPGAVAQFVEHARAVNFISVNDLREPEGFINLSNGVLDVRTRELHSHNPKYFFKYKLPHEYVEGAECPNWLEFLHNTFEGNQELVDVCAEIFGYILLGGNPFLHKAFVLSGEGRNGKSTFLDVLKYMIGKPNFSSIPVQNLEKPFSAIMADGKLANIVGETSAKEINSETFKTAVGGEELIAAQKGSPEYAMPFHARIVMACNKLPHVGDPTAGAHEKFLILPFNRYIEEKDRTAMFAQRMLFPEIAGIIQWSLGGLDRLSKRGMLPSVDALKQQSSELREEIDSVYAWWVEHVRLGEDVSFVTNLQFKKYYDHYRNWCDANGRGHVPAHTFSKRCMVEVRKNANEANLRVTSPGNVKTVSGNIAIDVKLATGAGLGY